MCANMGLISLFISPTFSRSTIILCKVSQSTGICRFSVFGLEFAFWELYVFECRSWPGRFPVYAFNLSINYVNEQEAPFQLKPSSLRSALRLPILRLWPIVCNNFWSFDDVNISLNPIFYCLAFSTILFFKSWISTAISNKISGSNWGTTDIAELATDPILLSAFKLDYLDL